MPENYEHYITKNIKAYYKRRLAAPILYLLLLFAVWHIFSLSVLIFPDHLDDSASLESAYREDVEYVSTTLWDLKSVGPRIYERLLLLHNPGK